MFCIMSVAESRELNVNLHFYTYWMINSEKVTFVYHNDYKCLLSVDRHLYTWNYLAARLQHMYLF
jgi:hypothetical protein